MNYSIASFKDPRSSAAEAYRTLRTNLQFSSPDKPIKSLVVTSATPGEGKSTTVTNLAAVFAQAGRKTLLVDADLRKPAVHKIFSINNERGLSNIIVSDDKIERVVWATWINNLYMLTSGPVPPNPAELLSSKKAKQLFARLEEDFDIVLVDSSPLGAVSDALMLATYATGTLLVFDYGRITKEQAKKVVGQLRNVKANIVGAVINRVPGESYGYHDYSEEGY